MPYTPVTPAQFKLLENGVAHLPTNARFTIHPGGGNLETSKLGVWVRVLTNGEQYSETEVAEMACRIWKEHLRLRGLGRVADVVG